MPFAYVEFLVPDPREPSVLSMVQTLSFKCPRVLKAKLRSVGRMPAMKYMLSSMMVHCCSLTEAQVASFRALLSPKITKRTIAATSPLWRLSATKYRLRNGGVATYMLPSRKVNMIASF